MNVIRKTVQLPDGREIIIETGKLAKQADGAVMVTLGKTMLLATVCSAQEANPGTDFMPLSVDYKEKFSACGRFPGGFLRREGRPSDYEILISHLMDRALRPLLCTPCKMKPAWSCPPLFRANLRQYIDRPRLY